MSEDAPKPQAQPEEAPTLHQGALAVETAPGAVAVPDLPGQCLRGGRHQGEDQTQQAPLESQFFPVGSGQAVVLRGTLEAGSCPDKAGLPNQGSARPARSEEDGEEAGGGVGGPLRRCMVSGVLSRRRAEATG